MSQTEVTFIILMLIIERIVPETIHDILKTLFQHVQSSLVIPDMRDIRTNTNIFLSPVLHLSLVQTQASLPFLLMQLTCPPLMS